MESKEKFIPTYREILKAQKKITPYIYQTPIFQNEWINKLTNSIIFFKCENLQKTGSFKLRGATNALLNYIEQAKKYGVVTHSSGNFAKALSYISSKLNVKTTVIMPRTSPAAKITGVLENNSDIIFSEPTLLDRQSKLDNFLLHQDAVFIPPYDDPYIIAGQGTATVEFIYSLGNSNQLDYLIAPIGGGGLISGTAIASKFLSPRTKVIGGEPKGADDAYRSKRDKKIYPSVNPKTIADGLLTSLSELTFSIILNKVDQILTVSEEMIVKAMKIIFSKMKIIIEPSSAVAFAVVLQYNEMFRNSKTGIILSGGNLDIEDLPF